MSPAKWPLLLPAAFIVLVWAAAALGSWIARKRISKALNEDDAEMARKYGPEWRQVVGWVKPAAQRVCVAPKACRWPRCTCERRPQP